MDYYRRARRYLKRVGPKTLRLTDDTGSWAPFLGVDAGSAEPLRLALTRMVQKIMDKTWRTDGDTVLREVIQRLLKAAHGENAFLICLAQSEDLGIKFETIDDTLRVYTWIQGRLDETITGSAKKRLNRDRQYWRRMVETSCALFREYQNSGTPAPLQPAAFIADAAPRLAKILAPPAAPPEPMSEDSYTLAASPEAESPIPMPAAEEEPADATDDLIEVEVEDDRPQTDPPQGLDQDVLAAWVEAANARVLFDESRLSIETPESEPEPPTKTPWTDIHDLINMDAHDALVGVDDTDLQAIHQELGEVERLLDLTAKGETDAVLAAWSPWLDPLRERLRALDKRLKDLAKPAVPMVVVQVMAPPPAPEPPTPPAAPPVSVEPPPTPAAPWLQLPEGELRDLFATAFTTLERLPTGTMRRQFKTQLDTLLSEALEERRVRSIKARVTAIIAEIEDFLGIIDNN